MPRRLQAWLGALWLLLGVACLLLVMLYAAAAAAQSGQPEPPAKLWNEYPLDPAASSERDSPPAPQTSPAARVTTQQRPATTARTSEPENDGSSATLRLGILAGVGVAVLLAAVSALSMLLPGRGHRKQRPAPAAAKPKANTRRESKIKAKPEQKIKAKPEPTPKPAARKPKQRALPVKAAERAPARRSSASPPAPREHQPNGSRAEVVPTHEVPAARAPEPRAANEPRPNGGGRPGTTWFTEPYESCEITLWRGYIRAQFYARPTFPEPGDYALEISPKFRLRGETPSARGAALAAYERLIEQLVRRGWEPSGLGGEWFEQWFRRRLPAGHILSPMEPAPPAQTPSGPS
jgi:hypothetical protein